MIVQGSLSSQDFDRAASVQYAMATQKLMEIAGRACADEIEQDFKKSAKKALLVSGPGNNGGDCFVIARFLLSYGWNVSLILLNPLDSYQGASLENLTILYQMVKDLSLGLQITLVKTGDTFCRLVQEFNPDVLVDGLFGTGLSREITGWEAELIKLMNDSFIPIYSVDIPSGISADTGQILGKAIKAAKTITFETLKVGHLLYPGKDHSGEVVIKNLGLPAKLKYAFGKVYTFTKPDELLPLLKERPRNSYKGLFGKAYLYGGSKRYPGAFKLALSACLKAGAGLVYGIYRESLAPFFTSLLPSEVIHEQIPMNQIGEMDTEHLLKVLSSLSRHKTALGIGPGLGRDTDVVASVKVLFKNWKGPLVVDADGLYAIKDVLSEVQTAEEFVLTPHLYEMSYLTGETVESIESDLIAVASKYANRWNSTVVLKSATTVIAEPRGKVFINSFGNQGMAKGGSGDVLTGIICSLLAQGYSPWDASVLGVSLHSLAGDLAGEKKGFYSLLPTDICKHISSAYQLILK